MAEIKSTMDLVMERMARMTANSAPVNNDEENEKAGMRLAADFLNGNVSDLAAELGKQPAEAQKSVYKGAAGILMRNITLPRDEMVKERADAALNGVMELAGALGVSSVSQLCSELQQILQQYNQHKEQVVKQLEDALRGQLEQQYAAQGIDPSQLRATMHPKYAEEMSKMQQDLNGQYLQAIDQRKDMILQQLGLA